MAIVKVKKKALTDEIVKKTFEVEMLTEILGTIPREQEIFDKFLASKRPAETNVVDEDLPEPIEGEEKGYTGFYTDPEKGLMVKDYQIRGFLKNAGSATQYQIDPTGIFDIKGKIDKFVFVFPRNIYLGVKEPDGAIERPLRVEDQRTGLSRVCLAKSDYVNPGLKFKIEIHVLPNKWLSMEMIESFLEYGQYCGLGQFRNGSYGRFAFKEIIPENVVVK